MTALKKLTAALLFSALSLPVCAGDFIVQGEAQVRDGGSLRIGKAEVRLFGIDAPEWQQNCFFPVYQGQIAYRCGVISRAQLMKIIGEQPLSCQPLGRERGRLVAWCILPDGETDVAEILVRRGWAITQADFEELQPDRFARYEAAQKLAREEKIGLWKGEFTIPERWRAEHRSEQ